MSDGFAKKDTVNKKSAYIKGGILGVLVSFLVMLVFASLLLFLDIDRAYAVPFATISIAIGTIIASRYTAKKIGEKGYIIGIVIGLTVFVTITCVSLILGNGLSINTLFHFVIILLASIVGGIMGVNSNKHKKLI